MSLSFKERVRKNKIISPTRNGFSLEDWNKEWGKENDKSRDNAEIYLFGIIIFSIFEEIREKLKSLYKKAPKISNEKLLMIYFSLSNRDRLIISKFTEKHVSEYNNFFSITLINKIIDNELTLQEVAENCVDGLEKAIHQCRKRLAKGEKGFSGSESSMDVMKFISREANLSQLYGIFENCWHALLWGKYQLIKIEVDSKVFGLEQKKNNLEVSAIHSQIRKQKLEAQSGAISSTPQIIKLYENDKYIQSNKIGKKRIISSKKLSSAPSDVVYMNAAWRSKEMFLVDEFPEDLLYRDCDSGFSVIEALNVFRCLALLSSQLMNEYPDDDSAYNIKKLLQFCPRIRKLALKKGIEKSTRYNFQKISCILDFMEYHGDKAEDLWCNPIVEVNGNEYALLTSSLITPSITRVVEHWLVKLGLDMQNKGITYENTLLSSLNKAVSENNLIKEFDNAVSHRIKLIDCEEEIDLLIRIDDLIILGEVKSIVTTDSPISQYRTLETLRYAAEQINRKSAFVRDHTEEVFSYFGWTFDSSKSYSIVSCIVNSGRMYMGSSIAGVPVIDEMILTRYFSSNEVPCISRIDQLSGKEIHLAWFVLYEDFNDLKMNFDMYLKNPPQIMVGLEDFEYKVMRLPCVNDDSYKIIYKRLVPKDISLQEKLGKKYAFPLRKIENVDKEISKMSIIF